MAALTLGNLLVSFQISVWTWVCVLRHVKIVKLARDVGALDMFSSSISTSAASAHQGISSISSVASAHAGPLF